ncbi:hypothetical protein SRHO_G00063280 [Serrasalmus rhombeus]
MGSQTKIEALASAFSLSCNTHKDQMPELRGRQPCTRSWLWRRPFELGISVAVPVSIPIPAVKAGHFGSRPTISTSHRLRWIALIKAGGRDTLAGGS